MESSGRRQQFDDIVDRLTGDDPSFGRRMRRASRGFQSAARVTSFAVGALLWGLLSVAMVVWGWRGVVLAVLVLSASAWTAVARRRR